MSELRSPGLGVDPETAERADDGVVYTAGVSSAVLDGEECLGHTLLLDLDATDAIAAYRVAAKVGEDDVAALFRSSGGSFHVWGLGVAPFEEAILSGLSWSLADPMHVAQSYRRGRYVLRVAPKVREDSTVYKDAPRLLDVWVPDEVERPQSLPHLRLAEERAREAGHERGEELLGGFDGATVGASDGLAVDRYLTLTDDAKADLRGE